MNETWMQAIAIIGSNLVIMLTIFSTSVTMNNSIREDVRAVHQEVGAIHQEMKDFHGRLCAIEERRLGGGRK